MKKVTVPSDSLDYFRYCAAAFGLAGVLSAPVALAQQLERPNVILIMTDQQRADAMGCASDGAVITPNLDALASEGYLFNNAYSSTPSSTPARAGLLTGCSPWNHGMLGYGNQAVEYPYEMPSMLKDLGYAAMAVGKMHYYPQDNTHGFDVLLYDESGRHTTQFFESDYRKWFYTNNFGDNPNPTGITWNEHRGGVCPYDPPQRFLDMYEGRRIPLPAKGIWVPEEWREYKDPLSDKSAFIGNFGDGYACRSRKHYYASVTFVDEQIGRVIEALKRSGMYDNSIIIFVSDHGDMLGDHHLWRKTYAYEGSAAIPFIVKLPRDMETSLSPGSTVDAPVELRDVLPTCLDINGACIPEGMDGMSVLGLLTGKDTAWRDYIDLEHARSYWDNNSWTALTDGHIKYIWFCASGEEQLFDLDRDPKEEYNLVGRPAWRRKLDEMRAAMVSHLQERGESWVRDGKLVIRKHKEIYGRNFPEKR
ncbi:MAG: sulfatase-like hydrolase/transferase [Bacteroidales bacterium]|nr:sulfatase-like hydrolase/transferase [Bacteroidales bacterium]